MADYKFEVRKTKSGYVLRDLTWEYGLKHKIQFARTTSKKDMIAVLKNWSIPEAKVKNIHLIK